MTATLTHHGLKTRLVVGMEIHVELATRTKMWTSAPNVAHPDHYDAGPNTLLDPVVIGMPGTLPVMNKRAVEMSMLVGLALGCHIARRTKWDRKSYYYPDLPKNYQISQYDQPLCSEGALDISVPGLGTSVPSVKTVRIIRAHLEEDAGKLLHEAPGGGSIDHSIVDLNRAGTPLLEIVTYPDIASPDEAVVFAQTLRDICRHLGVTEGIMQRGHMRFEPNINVVIEPPGSGQEYKTPIVEIKNLNSFRALHGAIAYEYERQVDEWLQTGVTLKPGLKSTRGWDDVRGETFLQREKEEAHDYRYFPDPDLVEVAVDEAWLERISAQLPELPPAKRRRYLDELGLDSKVVDQIISEPATTRFFEAVITSGGDAKRAAAVVLNQAAKRANEQGLPIDRIGISPAQTAAIIALQSADKIGSTAAADLFNLLCDAADVNLVADAVAEQHGLLQVSDTSALEGYVAQVLADPRNAKAVDDLKAGKDKAIGALMGQIMKLSKGKANPKLVTDMIRARVGG